MAQRYTPTTDFDEYLDTPPPSVYTTAVDERESRRRSQRTMDFVTYGAPAALVGFADTFTSSLGLTDDRQISDALKNFVPNFGQYYADNREAARTVGDLAGMFVPGMAGVKLIRGGSYLNRLVNGSNRSKLLSSVFTTGKTADQLIAKVRRRDTLLGRSGVRDVLADTERQRLVREATNAKLFDTIKETLAFEGAVLATMNESDVLYPEEFSAMDHIVFNATLPTVLGAAEVLYVRRLMRQSAGTVGLVANRVLNPQDLPLDQLSSQPGFRDIKVTNESMYVAAAEDVVQETSDQTLRQNLLKEINVHKQNIKNEIERQGRDVVVKRNGITSSTKLSNGQIQGELTGVLNDPTSALGTISIQNMPGRTIDSIAAQYSKVTDALEDLKVEIKKRQAKRDKFADQGNDQLRDEEILKIQQLRDEEHLIKSLEHYVREPDGTLATLRERKPLYQDNPEWNTPQNLAIANNEVHVKNANISIRIDENYYVNLKKRDNPTINGIRIDTTSLQPIDDARPAIYANFEAASLFERSAIYAGMQRQIARWTAVAPDNRPVLNATAADHHTHLDAVAELLSTGRVDMAEVATDDLIRSLEDVEWQALKQKYVEYTRLRTLMDELNGKSLGQSPLRQMNLEDIRKMLNLPGTSNGDIHPLFEVFETARVTGEETLDKVYKSYEAFAEAMNVTSNFPELLTTSQKQLRIRGTMMSTPQDAAPSMLIRKPVPDSYTSRDGLREATISNRHRTVDMLRNAPAEADIVQIVMRSMDGLAVTDQARQVNELVEGVQRGRGAFTQQTFAAGETPTYQAMSQLESITDREVREYVGNLFKGDVDGINYVENFLQLRKPEHRGDLSAFNLFVHARRQGWDLEAQPVMTAAGNVRFKLKKGRHNDKIWRRIFGDEEGIPDDVKYMPAPTGPTGDYAALEITPLAFQTVESVTALGYRAFNNSRYLRRVAGYGKGPDHKEFWVPPRNFAQEHVAYLMYPDGSFKAVKGARTKSSLDKLVQQELDLDPNLVALNRDDMTRYFDLQDRAFTELIDYTDSVAQTGRSKGTSVNEVIDEGPEVLTQIIDGLNRQFESVLRRTRILYFEPEINHARSVFKATSPESGPAGQSIWQKYLAAIFGNPTLNPNDLIGRGYYAIESTYDDMINVAYDKWRGVKSYKEKPDAYTKEDVRRYKALEKQLGEYNPFQSAADYAERTFNVSMPPRMKVHSAKLNQIAAMMFLRMFEVGHAILNMTSLAATMPPVIKALTKASHETGEEWASRIGAYGMPVTDGDGMFQAHRAIIDSVHSWFNDDAFRTAMKNAADRGYFQQDVAEIMRTITAPRQGYAEGLLSKPNTIITFLSDKSEELARSMAFGVGYNIARRGLKIQDENNAFVFAHKFANDVVGDYRPNNRPRIFQGAVGMPLGLFMTFALNYYQRIFNYIDNRQVGALVSQFAAQASVFGAQTVPGFGAFTEFWASNYDGTVNPVDGFRDRFGDEATEWFLYGTLSNLPKLFGSDDGVALYTRGDMQFQRIPGIWSFQETPGYRMVADAVKATVATGRMLRTEGGANRQQMAEIISNYAPSRPLRNLFDIYNGYDVDRRGNVIEGDVNNMWSVATRMAGMRPLNTAQRMEAYGKVRSVQLSQRDKMLAVRDNARAQIRSGDLDVDGLIQDYIFYGGNPTRFGQWLGDQFQASTVDRTQRELIKAIKDPTRGYDARRLMSVYEMPPNDPEMDQRVDDVTKVGRQ